MMLLDMPTPEESVTGNLSDILEYIKTPEFQERVNRNRASRRTEEWHVKNRAKVRKYELAHAKEISARKAVLWALKTGKIKRPNTCQYEMLGGCFGAIEAHHHNGYGAKLDVMWLCKHHHEQVDRQNQPLYSSADRTLVQIT